MLAEPTADGSARSGQGRKRAAQRAEPSIPDIGAIGGAELTEKHREVLREAMRLVAERGFRGASLRELARRVGMQQPSLYHYFRSKDELVEQILVTFGFGGIGATPSTGQLPERIEDYPALLASIVTWLYDHTEWPVFVRFMFNLSLESPKHQERLREMFVETTASQMQAVVGYYVRSGQIGAIDAEHLTRMVLSAVALPLIEERLLFPSAGPHRGLSEYIAFVVRFAKGGITARVLAEPTADGCARTEHGRKRAAQRADSLITAGVLAEPTADGSARTEHGRKRAAQRADSLITAGVLAEPTADGSARSEHGRKRAAQRADSLITAGVLASSDAAPPLPVVGGEHAEKLAKRAKVRAKAPDLPRGRRTRAPVPSRGR